MVGKLVRVRVLMRKKNEGLGISDGERRVLILKWGKST